MTAALLVSDAFLRNRELPLAPPLPAAPGDKNSPPCLARERWPLPRWTTRPCRGGGFSFNSYAACVVATQRSRYLELQNDFLTAALSLWDTNQYPKAEVEECARQLIDARTMLEQRLPNAVMCATALDAAEHHLVRLLPQQRVAALSQTVRAKLSALPTKPETLLQQIDQNAFVPDGGSSDDAKYRVTQGLLSEGIEIINRTELDQMINGGHQARRLQTWLWVAVATLILLIMATPQMSDLSKLSGDVTTFFGVPIPLSPMFDFAAYAIVLTVAVAGAVGGLVSGITTARDADDKAPALRAGNQLKLALKPIMGAILALLLLIFTSWAVIEGVVVTNLGMWYLLAFTAGFSERYFFKLLKLE